MKRNGFTRIGKRRLVMFVALAVCMAIVAPAGRWSDKPFDQAIWTRSHGIFWGSPMMFGAWLTHRPFDNQRARMVNDVVSHRLRTGMSTIDVRKLLGENDSGDGSGDYLMDVYWLVSEPTSADRQIMRLRWHTTNPRLFIEYGGPHMTVSRFWVGP